MSEPTSSYDLFYLSYDEPNKEEHWANLLNVAPWAKRVDGVKGFDAAHKACAEQSETDRFITVDGDNIVDPKFFELELDIPPKLQDSVLSWGARNIINGLCYGNGGLKLWTRDFVLNMRTHEAAETDAEKLDFCWDSKYVQMNGVFSETRPNGSPFQAFRAGFREGVKMTLDRGDVTDGMIAKTVHPINFQRLLIWASVGADVENGLWSIYGTRLGIYKANVDQSFDKALISDYDWFKNFFKQVSPWLDYKLNLPQTDILLAENEKLKDILQKELGLEIADLNPEQSRFFKAVHHPPRRNNNHMITEMEAAANA